jgi:thiosulfate/3-mercaptopyruvate sulfurtransferase
VNDARRHRNIELKVRRVIEVKHLTRQVDCRLRESEVEPVDRVPGHIPGARNAPTGGNLRPDGRFMDAAQLASRYAELGSDEGPIVVSCGSGVTACHAALAMRIAGLAAPLLYAGSYSDWTAAGLPIATGPEPGTVEST